MFNASLKRFLSGAYEYSRIALRRMVIDRGMFFTDFILATATPYFIQYLIWKFVYGRQGQIPINGYTYPETLLYFAYAIALGRLNNGYGVVQDLSDAVAEGKLETYTVKPYPYPLQRFWDFFGGGFLYWVPILMIFVWHLTSSHLMLDHFNSVPFMLSLLVIFFASQILCFLFSYCVAVCSFWLVRHDGLLALLSASAAFFGGILLPPEFWPESLRPLMLYNPFRYMIAAPAELFVRGNSKLMLETLLATSVYIIFFGGLATFGWRKAMNNYSSVGG